LYNKLRVAQKSVFSLVNPAVNMALHAAALLLQGAPGAPPLSIDISCPHALSSKPAAHRCCG